MTRARIVAFVLAASAVARADPPPPSRDKRLLAAAAVGALYAGYATWSYFAWYRGANSSDFHREASTDFQLTSYAGGADKVGHAWAANALSRATTGLLIEAGWRRRPSSLVGSGLAELAFLLTEIEDGYTVGFDVEDMIANTSGALFALLLDNLPAIDRMIDLRVAYIPSSVYRHNFRTTGSLDVAQDYTGQTYLLAFHLEAIPALRRNRWFDWTRYVDVAIGFETRNYSPVPEVRTDPVRQSLYLGFALNMQHVIDRAFCGCRGRKIGHAMFEVFSLPYTTLPVIGVSREHDYTP